MKFVRIVLGLLFTALLAACGGGGGSPGANPNAGALRTSAGASVVIAPGETRAYTISGGVSPYSVRNADPLIALGSVSGTQLTIAAKGIGSTSVEVVDNTGAATTIAVRIGSSTPVSVTAPASLSLGLGPNAAQTFDVRGGVAPYTATSSDARIVGVYLDPTTLKLTVTGLAVGTSIISVRDGANEVADFNVTTTAAQPLSVSAPASLTVAVGSTQSYKILGGVKPYLVSSSNPAVLTASKQFEDDLVIRGISGGTTSVKVTDIAGSVVTLSARVGSDNPLFTSAPAALTLAPSTTSATYTISGGAAPYTVTSSNTSVAAVTFAGTNFSISAGATVGTASIVIKDSTGSQVAIALAVAVAGGGSTAIEPAATIEVLASSNTLQSGGLGVDITAYVKNRLNAAMPNEPVSFSADSGLLQSASTTTDTNGLGTAKLLVGADKSNRTIRVTVRSGTASGFVNVEVVGTRVILTGDAAVQQGSTATYTVRVVDSAGNGIPGAQAVLSSSLGNGFSPATATTDSLGFATTTYTATNATSVSTTETLTATSLGASSQLTITVSNVVFRFTTPTAGTNVVLGTPQPLTVQYTVGGAPGSGTVSFTTTRGTIAGSPALIGSAGAGLATVTLNSTSASGAGPVTILAQIPGVGQASLQLNFVAETPSSIALQANPSAIPPNSGGSTLSQSTVEATVRDANNNPVANRQVNFSITSDVSGGALSSPSALTDLNGRAQVQYIAGSTTTSVNGVTISATVNGTAITNSASLTVSGQSLFITIGYGNDISNVDSTTYSKPFSVYLTDATGNAVGSQAVSVSIEPLAYLTGQLARSLDGNWGFASGSPTAVCKNTDTNLNGIVDGTEVSPLRPGNVVVATPSPVTTDGSGRATFNLQYGEQFAPWVIIKIVARTTVAGTESVREALFSLVGSVEDFSSEGGPAGTTSPYGVAVPADCVPYP